MQCSNTSYIIRNPCRHNNTTTTESTTCINITNSEDIERFISRYGEATEKIRPAIEFFPPEEELTDSANMFWLWYGEDINNIYDRIGGL